MFSVQESFLSRNNYSFINTQSLKYKLLYTGISYEIYLCGSLTKYSKLCINSLQQMVIEVIAASDSGDSELALTGLGDQLQGLELQDWLHLLESTTSTLLCLVHRVKVSEL